MAYSKELKNSIIAKMLPPNNQSIRDVQRESGIGEGTLKKWKAEAMKKGIDGASLEKNSEKWSTKEKFAIVLETSTLSEVELSEYCRKKGLHVEQLKSWQDNCLQANGGVAKELAQSKQNEKEKEFELKKIKKELQRKEAALAETAALLVLRKKADAIWGEPEGE